LTDACSLASRADNVRKRLRRKAQARNGRPSALHIARGMAVID
jgi:hypothetical protein